MMVTWGCANEWINTLSSYPYLQISFIIATVIILVTIIQDCKDLTVPGWLLWPSTLISTGIWLVSAYHVGGGMNFLIVSVLVVFLAIFTWGAGGFALMFMSFNFGEGDVWMFVPFGFFFPSLSLEISVLPFFEPFFSIVINPLTYALNTILVFALVLLGLKILRKIKNKSYVIPLTPAMAGSFILTMLFGSYWWGIVSYIIDGLQDFITVLF